MVEPSAKAEITNSKAKTLKSARQTLKPYQAKAEILKS
jgi:hypothetical protein